MDPLVISLPALDHGSVAIAGGKGANLGELLRIGMPVPPGFCVTTAAYMLAVGSSELEQILERLAKTRADDTTPLEGLAEAARSAILALPVPEAVASAVTTAYAGLHAGEVVPVAVRSSATAEDLPAASFAGQQDTFLNVVGSEALLDAVRRCWASLWTGRAVAYRAVNGIDPRTVRLAVVVQEMVPARVAGVLFTANPVTGRRGEAVLDASPGLGEAIVSGAVNPDHFEVDVRTGEIRERRLGDKRVVVRPLPTGGTERVANTTGSTEPCLVDEETRTLVDFGVRVEEHYRTPQDIEFAIDRSGKIWLTQARPITSLFPLPGQAAEGLRVYFSVNVAQGVFRPFTPMGIQAFQLAGAGLAGLFGRPPADPEAGPPALVEAAQRLFLDVTLLLRSQIGRRLFLFATRHMESRTAAMVAELARDPRLCTARDASRRLLGGMLALAIRARLPFRALRALHDPAGARRRLAGAAAAALALGDVPAGAAAAQRLGAARRLLLRGIPMIMPEALPILTAGFGTYMAAMRLLGESASPADRETVRRALPHNPTTEMDLALWRLSRSARADPAVARCLSEQSPEDLAGAYRSGALPEALQVGLARFLAAYGHRAVAEIDVGLPRWSEDPAHLLAVLGSYLRLEDGETSPDAQFRRAAAAAESMVEELASRASSRGRWRGRAVRFLLRRHRELAGLREAPKFYFVALLARARALLRGVGDEIARAGRLEHGEDIFFLALPEARAALHGADLYSAVKERRVDHARELHRRHVPRLLLSDGTEPEALFQLSEATENAPGAGPTVLRGTPASAGLIIARARVILDPHGARLEPGEILVAPSTDPGWTPLFLTAAGLVMEMGGSMSHGAVVAREYGIPAVVGVAGATERIPGGSEIAVDGAQGLVRLLPDSGETTA